MKTTGLLKSIHNGPVTIIWASQNVGYLTHSLTNMIFSALTPNIMNQLSLRYWTIPRDIQGYRELSGVSPNIIKQTECRPWTCYRCNHGSYAMLFSKRCNQRRYCATCRWAQYFQWHYGELYTGIDSRRCFYWHDLPEIQACISNHIYFMWDEITHSRRNFNGGLIKPLLELRMDESFWFRWM